MHMADKVNLGVALDHQGHVRFRVAQFSQLHLLRIVGRDLQHATKAAKPILNGRGLCIAGVFSGKPMSVGQIDRAKTVCTPMKLMFSVNQQLRGPSFT